MTVKPAFSQEKTERTLDEIKTEAIHRAEVGGYPLIGLDPANRTASGLWPSDHAGLVAKLQP